MAKKPVLMNSHGLYPCYVLMVTGSGGSGSDDTDYHNKQSIRIKKIIMHSKYDPETANNDIALLKLKGRVHLN